MPDQDVSSRDTLGAKLGEWIVPAVSLGRQSVNCRHQQHAPLACLRFLVLPCKWLEARGAVCVLSLLYLTLPHISTNPPGLLRWLRLFRFRRRLRVHATCHAPSKLSVLTERHGCL